MLAGLIALFMYAAQPESPGVSSTIAIRMDTQPEMVIAPAFRLNWRNI